MSGLPCPISRVPHSPSCSRPPFRAWSGSRRSHCSRERRHEQPHWRSRAPAEESEGTRSQVLRWLKAPGERVASNEPLIELETDKVTVEVASPASGRPAVDPEGRAGRESPPGSCSGTSVARRPPAGRTVARTPAARRRRRSAERRGCGARAARAQLSPAVRRLCPNMDSSWRGPGHRAGRADHGEDVLEAAAGAAQEGSAPAAAAAATPEACRAARCRTRRVRKRIAEHMVQSLLHTAPHVTSVFEVDMSAVYAHRAQRARRVCTRAARR